ncbi:hypothetical protein HZC09_00775 [Candidatus Micrarchaeota archaeon]|nr:hypothetical protein [Candidatus Micrarchaeota archaeon]
MEIRGTLSKAFGAYKNAAGKIGEFNTKIILGAVYFTLFTLYSLASKLSGRDPLHLKQKKEQSYWVKSESDAR